MNLKTLLALPILLVTSVVLTACSTATAPATVDTPSTEEVEYIETEVEEEVPTESTRSGTEASTQATDGRLVLTMSELAKHNSAKDCWLLVEGKVYDVTPYIANAKHPGGAAILEGCGIDATSLFNERPMGSGTPHSDKARMGLDQYYIGELVRVQ